MSAPRPTERSASAGDPGRTVFLSYNRENSREAVQVRDWLRDEGLDVFMDNVHLMAGERWLDRLKQEVAQALAFVVLIRREGPRGFVVEEISWILERRSAALAPGDPAPCIFPVCLGEVPDERSLDPRVKALLGFQVTLWQPGHAMPVGLLSALREALPASHFSPQQSPFRGLSTFEEADADWFFGRKREIYEVTDGLGSAPTSDGIVDREAPDHHRYVLISGDSGSGKSSLLRAGVLPQLRKGALWGRTGLSRWCVVGPMRPGARPLAELHRAFTSTFGSEAPVGSRLDGWRSDGGALLRLLADNEVTDTGTLLVLDQMEELLQSGIDERERAQFGNLLATALQSSSGRLYVIGTVRADALAELDTFLPELVRVRNRCGLIYSLPRISASGLRLTIEEPARRAGIDVSDVTEVLLGEARNEPGALALVQHALWSLWRTQHRLGPVSRLLRRDHEAAGGLAGMLSHDADAAVAEVMAQVDDDAGAMNLLRQMVWVGAEDRLFRRRVRRSEAEWLAGEGNPERGARVIALLSGFQAASSGGDIGSQPAAHLPLLVTGNDGDTDDYVELVHEMLLRTSEQSGGAARPNWPRLYELIQRHLNDLRLEQRLRTDVQAWQQLGTWQQLRRLASLKEQRVYARLPRSPDRATRRYLGLSRTKSAGLVAAVSLPLIYLGIGSFFVFQQPTIFPIGYAARLPLWALGFGTEPEFVRLPGATATFDFGCDLARDTVGRQGCDGLLPLQRNLSLPISCDMGRYEVSFEQFDRFVFSTQRAGAARRAYPSPGEKIRGDLPVMEVSRGDAQAYADWLSSRSRDRRRYRLPMEWEWEYAARAGSAGPYPWGGESPVERANFDPGTGASPAARSVRSGPANTFGLHNVVGNASEWVADDANQASGAPPGYVLRGGSFNQGAAQIRIASRQSLETDLSGDMGTATNIGFRLCRER